jgi:hypothetical protein
MIRTEGTIEDFIKIKDNCIFCDRPLMPILTNLTDHSPQLGNIKAMLYKDQQFKFRLKYERDQNEGEYNFNWHYESFDVDIYVNIKDNKFGFFLYGPAAARYEDVARAFENMKPCIELFCFNPNCRMGYYIQSNYMSIGELDYIRPLGIYLEAFKTSKLWVANCYTIPSPAPTWIHSVSNPNANPIEAPRIDFSSYPKGKLINRIKTIVNFS